MRWVIILLFSCFVGGWGPGHLSLSGGGAPSTPAGTVFSKSFFNNSGSSTPVGGSSNTCSTAVNTCFPVHTFVGFAPGGVPSGSIAVPTVGGNPVRYQADRCARPWHDGSSAGCQFSLFLPQIGAGALEQVVWTVQVGSYNNTSGCTTSCITGNSNLNVKLTDVNQTGFTSPDTMNNVEAGAYINPSTGAVTSAVVRSGYAGGGAASCPSNVCHANVYSYVNAGGSGNCTGSPAFTISGLPATGVVGATVTVTSAGSGCPAGPGSSNATASINMALSNGAYNSSNHCGIVRQYLQGPVADGWEVACRFTDDNGTTGQWTPPAPVMRAWVEDWKNSDGTVYALRALAMVVQDEYIAAGTFSPFTYDVQWYNGSTPTSGTCLRCENQGYLPLTRIVTQFASAGITFEPDARMDWIPVGAGSTTSAQLNAVVGTYQAADKVYFKGSHLIPPIDDNVVLGSSATVTATGTQFSTASPCCSGDIGSFNSNNLGEQSNQGAFSSGGDHPFFFIPNNMVIQYLSTTQASDYGFSWTQNIRNAAATSFSCNAGYYDPDTRYAIDLIDSSVWTPPVGMVARPTASTFNFGAGFHPDMINANLPCWVNNGSGWNAAIGATQGDYSHWQNLSRWIYIQEGEEWQLQALDAAAQTVLVGYATGHTDLGTTKYYATANIIQSGSRLPAWSWQPLVDATKFLPSADVNAQYDYQVMFNSVAALMANTLSFTGTVSASYFFNLGPGTKPFDVTASGGPQGTAAYFANSVVNAASATVSTEYFADAYLASILLDAEMLFPGESASLDTWAQTFVDNYALGRSSQNSCLVNWLDYIGYASDSNKRFVPGWEADSANPQHFNEYIWNFAGPTLTTYSGDTIVDMAVFGPGTGWLAPNHTVTVTAGPVTVNPSGTTVISVADTSSLQIGDIVTDLGAGCSPSCPGVGGALPTTTGAIPRHMYISAISTASGPGTISIKCGATGGCASPSTTVNNTDILPVSYRLDFPPSMGSDGFTPLSQAGNPPMPAGTLIKPVWENTTNSGDNHLGSFPPTTSPANGINDSVTTGGYVWCPDAANPEGTTGTILPHGGTCGVTAPFNYAADGAVTWGFAPPLSACTGMTGNWRYGGGAGTRGNISPKTEEDQLYHLARFATAVLGTNATRATVISQWGPYSPPTIYSDPATANFAWDSSFSYPTPPGQ